MFEFEVNHTIYPASQIDSDIVQHFSKQQPNYAAVSVLRWEEHCTECAIPACYQTCDLYAPRKDGKCRRFIEGIAAVNNINGSPNRLVKVMFKKWGSLMATGYLDLVETNVASKYENKAITAANIAAAIPDHWLSIMGRRGISSRMVTRYKKSLVANCLNNNKLNIKPDYFLIELYNPNDFDADLTFVIRAEAGDKNPTPYQQRLQLKPGFHNIQINYDEIAPFLDYNEKHFVSLVPNIDNIKDETLTVYFGTLGFVKENEITSYSTHAKTVKVVAWDLDNTVWKGTLIEDGADKLQLIDDIKTIMQTLDQRGIVNSVVSKNNHDDAMQQLKKFGLDELIVYPQISWNPKGEAIKNLIQDFNVAADTIVFIDDQPFEREEVKSTNPDVRVIDASEYKEILERSEFNPEQSTESARRREFYQSQSKRHKMESSFSGDYLDFVRECNIKLNIASFTANVADRIHELVQRTNQMNFSGNRYSRDEINALLENSELDTYCMQCEDKFGDYGTVGFCIVDNTKPQLIDLMFSCRIQSKRVEHAFISWLLQRYKAQNNNQFSAIYNKTPKNEPSGRVFADIGFSEIENINNKIIYQFDLQQPIPNEDVLTITFKG